MTEDGRHEGGTWPEGQQGTLKKAVKMLQPNSLGQQ